MIMNKKKLARRIEEHYRCHGVLVKLKFLSVDKKYGRYIFRIIFKPGTKESLVFERTSDIKIALQMPLFQLFKENLSIYLAVSEKNLIKNSLLEMLSSQEFCNSKDGLPIALGYDLIGRMIFEDLEEIWHALYAGSTKSGKSTGLTNLILSLVVKQPVSRCNMIIFDTGANSMAVFEGVPHLSHSIIKDINEGMYVIRMLVKEMERRINLEESERVKQPAIICVIDEYITFIENINEKSQSKEVKNAISDILRHGRHGKIHMVLVAHNPTEKNVMVDISNMTARMAFKCAKYQNSITILGESGAEKLSSKGAMLYKSNKYPSPKYIQAAYMSPEEVRRVVERVKSAEHDLSSRFLIPEWEVSEPLVQEIEGIDSSLNGNNEEKELANIIMWVLEIDNVSANKLKKQFSMGNRAKNIIVKLHKMGIVADKFANQPRKVLPQSFEDVPREVIDFLKENGISAEEILNIFQQKSI